MTYSDILVHVPLARFKEQVDVGVSLAKTFRAHLTGVSSLPEASMLRSALDNPFLHLSEDEVEGRIRWEYEKAQAAKLYFTSAAKRAGLTHDWLTGEGDASDLLVHASRLNDLAIVEQGSVASELLWGPAVYLALSGHATLVVPTGWRGQAPPRRALVAWNDSTQAAAAVRNALPLLLRAKEVKIVRGPSREAFPQTRRMPPTDVFAYLRHHGIKATTSRAVIPDAVAGERILKAAKTMQADLIVMGAFGRSRFREWVLGGATRHVLEHMTVPVFMAH